MVGGRPQVLADGDDVATDAGQVGEGAVDLCVRLAQADDQRRLGGEARRPGPCQHGEAPGVRGRGPHRALEAGDRLEVVVQHVGPGVEHDTQRVGVALAVGDEHLHRGTGVDGTDGPDGGDELGGPAVGQVVTGHRRDHGVRQAHLGHRLGDPHRLTRVGGLRPTGVDQAESAGPGATLAVDHEGGGAVVPALEDVGAAGLLAHRDERLPAHQALQAPVLRTGVELHLHPLGLASHRRRLAGALSPGEGRKVDAAMAPRHVRPVDRPLGPALGGPLGHAVDDLAHRHIDALGGQRRDPELGDAARDHPVEEREVGVDVEGEAVHGAAAAQPDADGGDLAGIGAVGAHPDARVGVEAADVCEPEVAAHVDDQRLDRADVVEGVGHAAAPLARQVQQRIADELPRTVEGDVAAPVGPFEVGADLTGGRQEVLGGRPDAECVDGMVLEQQQVVVGALGEDPLLEGEGVPVADPAQPADPERPAPGHGPSSPAGHSPTQSLDSSTSRTRRRKDAA